MRAKLCTPAENHGGGSAAIAPLANDEVQKATVH